MHGEIKNIHINLVEKITKGRERSEDLDGRTI
jgi:hypothetical protein